jgi:hypothetical protein
LEKQLQVYFSSRFSNFDLSKFVYKIGAGLSTIRAYKLEDDWRKRFYNDTDEWTVRYVIFKEGQKWASMCASLISTLFMTGVIVIGWFFMSFNYYFILFYFILFY